jgi:2-iminobutanoate/2-iminopropanoate deaminase
MPKQEIKTDKAPKPVRPYSQGVKAGNLIFVAGQVPKDAVTGKIVGTTIQEQTEQVMRNVQAVLEAGGATLDDVVKVTVHLSDLTHGTGFDEVYGRFFSAPLPVRTTVGSHLGAGFMVEVDVIASVE